MKISELKLGAVLLATVMAFASCSKEQPALTPDNVLESKIDDVARTATFTLRTGAESYALTTPAEAREKQINSLVAYLFTPQGVYVETVTPQNIAGSVGEYKVKSTAAGSYQMVLVANLAEVSNLTGKRLSDLHAHLVQAEAGNKSYNNFGMRNLGEAISIQTYEEGGSDYRGVPILMERLAARFDVTNLSTSYTITQIEMKSSAKQSQLYNNNGDGKQLEASRIFTVANGFLDASMRGGSAKAIYAYENNTQDAQKKTSFVISGSVAGVALKPIEVSFPAVKRNHLYRVQITDKSSDVFKPVEPKPGEDPLARLLTLSIEVLDWNTGTVLQVFKKDIDKVVEGTSASGTVTVPDYNDGGTINVPIPIP